MGRCRAWYVNLDEWSCLIGTYVLNDLAEHYPETSDAVMELISDSIVKTVEHLWEQRPADTPTAEHDK